MFVFLMPYHIGSINADLSFPPSEMPYLHKLQVAVALPLLSNLKHFQTADIFAVPRRQLHVWSALAY